MIECLNKSAYVKSWVSNPKMKSVFWYDIVTEESRNVSLITNNIDLFSDNAYATLITDDFTLRFDGKTLELVGIDSDTVYDKIVDINITEECFFQQSTVKNFGNLMFEEIKFIKEVFNSRYAIDN